MIFAIVRDILAIIGALFLLSFGGGFAWIAFRSWQHRKEHRAKYGTPLNRKENEVLEQLAEALREGDE